MSSALYDIPLAMPALNRACKLQKRAATTGFDWSSTADVLEKVREEIDELDAEIQAENNHAMEEELVTCCLAVNLARHMGIDPERAMRSANGKFQRRFEAMENLAAEDNCPPLSEMSVINGAALEQGQVR